MVGYRIQTRYNSLLCRRGNFRQKILKLKDKTIDNWIKLVPKIHAFSKIIYHRPMSANIKGLKT